MINLVEENDPISHSNRHFTEVTTADIIANSVFLEGNRNQEVTLKNVYEMVNKYKGSILLGKSCHYLTFPGDRDSFIQLTVNGIPCPSAYTITCWIRLEKNAMGSHFYLFKSRSPLGGLECLFNIVDCDSLATTHLTIKTIVDNGVGNVDSHEVQGKIELALDKWVLIALVHVNTGTTSTVSLSIDGNPVFEQTLAYPFTHPPTESQWYIGTGLKGSFAGIALYSEEVSQNLQLLLVDAGPSVSSLDHPLIFPRTAVDTGHSNLGILWGKGNLVSHFLQKFKPVFVVHPLIFEVLLTANFSEKVAGSLCAVFDAVHPVITTISSNTDNFCVMKQFSHSNPNSIREQDQHYVNCFQQGAVSICGNVLLQSDTLVQECWIRAGGCMPLLHMLSIVCATSIETSNIEMLSAVISDLLLVLASILKLSIDVREQFIQLHGFHIIANRISLISQKMSVINDQIVDACFEVVRSMGLDTNSGDGIAAALQGLLFNFHDVWGQCSIDVKEYLLINVIMLLSNIVHESNDEARQSDADDDTVGIGSGLENSHLATPFTQSMAGEQVYKCIGVRRLLDILKLYLSAEGCDINQNVTLLQITTNKSEQLLDKYSRASEMLLRLLTLAMDYLLQKNREFSDTNQTTAFTTGSPNYEIELILLALEDVESNRLLERMLRLVVSFRWKSPDVLLSCMRNIRFSETTALYLLTKKGAPLSVRKMALLLTLWEMGEDLKHIPVEVNNYRKLIVSDSMGANQQLAQEQKSRLVVKSKSSDEDFSMPQSSSSIKNQRSSTKTSNPRSQVSQAGSNTLASSPILAIKDKIKWEHIFNEMKLIEKSWYIVQYLADIICLQMPKTEVSSALGLGTFGTSEILSSLEKVSGLHTTLPSTHIQLNEWEIENQECISCLPPSPSGAPEGMWTQNKAGLDADFEATATCPIDELLDIFAHDGPLASSTKPSSNDEYGTNHLHVWLILPFLPVLLSFTSLHNFQRTLMSLSVTMKTEDSETFLLSMLSDVKFWIKMFLQLVAIAKVKRVKSASPRENNDLADTCIELSLDCLSMVLEKRMRYPPSRYYAQLYHSYKANSRSSIIYDDQNWDSQVHTHWGTWVAVFDAISELEVYDNDGMHFCFLCIVLSFLLLF